MNVSIMAARTAKAIQKIAEKTGIDISPGRFPKTNDSRVKTMHQLEELARELPDGSVPDNADQEEALISQILVVVRETKGVGPALYGKIEERVRG
jgi:hypothetical protein